MKSAIVFVCLLASASALVAKTPVGTPAEVALPYAGVATSVGTPTVEPKVLTCPMPAKWYSTTLDSLADDMVLETDGLVEKTMAEEMSKKPKALVAPDKAGELKPQEVWELKSSLKPLGKNADTKSYLPEDADITKYVDAVKDARLAKQQFAKAQAELMGAMEGLLQVPAADSLFLKKAANGANGHDSLIVFYAPWCPHCQTMVLHDEKGDPTNAPLEQLKKKWAFDAQMENIHIMRADITKVGQVLPAAFKVVGIPTAYFISSLGEAKKFVGNIHDDTALRQFVTDAKPALLQSVAAASS